jgi:exosortase/archaeosortase family protein
LITSLLAGHLFLGSLWRKGLLALLTIPIAIFKNAVRIVTISWLSVYIDRDYLYGRLHHSGGILFALVGFGIMLIVLFVLQKSETRTHRKEARLDAILPLPKTVS